MKRFVGTILLITTAGLAMAQAPFTIARPYDGARVRETVRILIPKNSVPPGGYIGFFAGSKFLEATVPGLDKTKRFYEYDLDTKGRKIPDGKLSLEAVLYEDYNDAPRIINRSSVVVNLQNSAANTIPNKGALLRYKWQPGTQSIYDVDLSFKTESGSTAQNNLGARAAQSSEDVMKFRMLYGCDRTFDNGDGLVRLQAMPLPGQHYAVVQTADDSAPRPYSAEEMYPIYMRLDGEGHQVWGSIPFATPLEGLSGGGSVAEELFANFPLPVLPNKKVQVGSNWAARYQDGTMDLANAFTQKSLVEHIPMRGEFVGIEWEMNHPCAKIVNTIEVAQQSDEAKKLAKQNADFTGNKVQVTQTFWFALDKGEVVKVHEEQTIERQVTAQSGYGGGGPMGPTGGPMGPGAPGAPGSPRGGGSSSGASDFHGAADVPTQDFQQKFGQGAPTGPRGPGGPAGMPGRGGFGRPGGRTGGAPSMTGFERLTMILDFTLEQ